MPEPFVSHAECCSRAITSDMRDAIRRGDAVAKDILDALEAYEHENAAWKAKYEKRSRELDDAVRYLREAEVKLACIKDTAYVAGRTAAMTMEVIREAKREEREAERAACAAMVRNRDYAERTIGHVGRPECPCPIHLEDIARAIEFRKDGDV